jgi:hypothetical protein
MFWRNPIIKMIFSIVVLCSLQPFAYAQESPTLLLNSNGTSDSADDVNPRMTTDGKGTWLVVWHSFEDFEGAGTDSDIFWTRSADDGKTWSAVNTLNTNARTDEGSDELPTLATDAAGNWIATWYSREDLNGTVGNDLDIFVSRSNDNGETWTSPAILNSNADVDTGDDGWPQINTDEQGMWLATWWAAGSEDDETGPDIDIFISTSVDNGASWTPRRLLNSDGNDDTGVDAEPRLTTDYRGNWLIVWRCYLDPGDSDIAVSTSNDNGRSWTPRALLNSNGDTDTGDDYYPHVATDRKGNWLAVWRSEENLDGITGTDRDIFYATSTNIGADWSPPKLLNTSGTTDTGRDQSPQAATDGAGTWKVIWFSDDDQNGTAGKDDDIFTSTSTDNGNTWTDPKPIDDNATSDTQGDFVPDIATDRRGTWWFIWDSQHNLRGTAGEDFDIFALKESSPQ